MPGQRRRDDHIRAVAWRDEDGALLDVIEEVGHRHRGHLDTAHLPVEIVAVAGQQLGIEGLTQLGERGVVEAVVLGQRPHRRRTGGAARRTPR